MSTYSTYAHPGQSIDIPANPGYRARLMSDGGHRNAAWYDVVAWRINQGAGQHLGYPIVVGTYGLSVLYSSEYQFLEILFPGQEVDG